jgi:hypothetical protein
LSAPRVDIRRHACPLSSPEIMYTPDKERETDKERESDRKRRERWTGKHTPEDGQTSTHALT